MTLKEWLKKHNIRPYVFAKSLGISPTVLYKNLSGERRMSAKLSIVIEKETKGEVSKTEALWPELTYKTEQTTIYYKDQKMSENTDMALNVLKRRLNDIESITESYKDKYRQYDKRYEWHQEQCENNQNQLKISKEESGKLKEKFDVYGKMEKDSLCGNMEKDSSCGKTEKDLYCGKTEKNDLYISECQWFVESIQWHKNEYDINNRLCNEYQNKREECKEKCKEYGSMIEEYKEQQDEYVKNLG